MEALTGAEIDTLVALVERGPLRDGGLPSKVGRNGLLALGYAAQVVIDQDYMYYAATNKGLEWYLGIKQTTSKMVEPTELSTLNYHD